MRGITEREVIALFRQPRGRGDVASGRPLRRIVTTVDPNGRASFCRNTLRDTSSARPCRCVTPSVSRESFRTRHRSRSRTSRSPITPSMTRPRAAWGLLRSARDRGLRPGRAPPSCSRCAVTTGSSGWPRSAGASARHRRTCTRLRPEQVPGHRLSGAAGHRAGGAGGTTRLLARGDLARGPRSVAGRDRVPRVAGTGVPILEGTTSSFGRGRRGRPRTARGGALTSAGHHRRPAAALRPPARRGVHLAQRRCPGVRVLGRTHPGRRRPCGRRRGVDHEPTEAEPVFPLHRRT